MKFEFDARQILKCILFFEKLYRKVEMETKRKMEEIERKRQEDEDLRAAVALQVRQLIEKNV